MSPFKPGSRKIFIVELPRSISRGRSPASGVETLNTGKFFLNLDNCFCFHEVDGIACLPDSMRPSRWIAALISRLSKDDRPTENPSDTPSIDVRLHPFDSRKVIVMPGKRTAKSMLSKRTLHYRPSFFRDLRHRASTSIPFIPCAVQSSGCGAPRERWMSLRKWQGNSG